MSHGQLKINAIPHKEMQGMKFDDEKPDMNLVLMGFKNALVEVSKVGTFGARKYAANNWLGVDKSRYASAALRHRFTDETHDSESELLHKAHEAWNVLAELELMILKNED